MTDMPDIAKTEDKSCCSSGHGHRGSCCCAKALKVLILLLVGGIIGYLMGSAGPGRWCGWHHHGGSDAMPMAMDQTSAK